MKVAHVIIGSGYGDCGKGLMTDYFSNLYQNEDPIVIRYNGGAQAGHTVKTPDGMKHVFRHIGSGTLLNVPTYLDKEFIVNPILFNIEYNELHVYPNVMIHPSCRVTTPYDMLLNQIIESSRSNRHGSCGVGIFETITRHKEIPLDIKTLAEMSTAQIVNKMKVIKAYATQRLESLGIVLTDDQAELLELDVTNAFIEDVNHFLSRSFICTLDSIVPDYNVFIFESAQGLLLSEKHGEMPHLTPSDPGLERPLELCNEIGVTHVNVCYVTRCYTTRHGNGPLFMEGTAEQLNLTIQDETNVTNEHQGHFRYAPLNTVMVGEAIQNDFKQSATFNGLVTRQLAITCIDQLPSYKEGITIDSINYMNYIRMKLGISDGFYSIGPTRNDVYKSTQV